MPVNIDVTVYRGDTWQQKFKLKQGSPPIEVDLSSLTIESTIYDSNTQIEYDLICVLGDQLDPNELGTFTLALPMIALDPTEPTILSQPPPANYAWDVQTTDEADPPNITTWIAGRFFLEKDVTA